VDCYFHANVPSVAACADCRKPVCATCRDDRGTCPSCRLAAKIDAATAPHGELKGNVPPRDRQAWRGNAWRPDANPATRARATVSAVEDPIESRALVALGFPLWPLAVVSLFDRKHSRKLRTQAYQAIGFNVGMAALFELLRLVIDLPVLNVGAGLLLAFMLPIFVVLSVYYGIKVWHGESVHVPIIGDWLDDKLPA
jgi:hypothetical protein